MERAQYLYIDSSQCVGTPYDFKVSLPVKALQCEKNERIRVSLVRWTCRHDWYTIREPDNVFYINNEALIIPEGNYKYSAWAETLDKLIQTVSPGASVTFSQNTHKLTFKFTNIASRSFRFPHRRARAWGFTEELVVMSGTTLVSTVPLNFYDDDERILISCEGIHPHRGRHLAHGSDGAHADAGNVLACVLVNNSPYETLVYESDGAAFGHQIQEGHVHSTLHFKFNTTDGTLCTWLPHSHMVLKFEAAVDHSQLMIKQLNVLRSMEEVLRMLLVSQHLNTPNDMSDPLPTPQN